jgi:hypothetical protein
MSMRLAPGDRTTCRRRDLLQVWIAIRVSATPPAHAGATLAGAPMANGVLRVLSFFNRPNDEAMRIVGGGRCSAVAR